MSTPGQTTDLTQRPPRSPRVRLGGYVLLPRIIDKGRAAIAGRLGEYHYEGKGIDRHFFNFVGVDHESLKAELSKGAGDGEILAWVEANAKTPRQPWEIASWSDFHSRRGSDSDEETMHYFSGQVKKFAPLREDIATWFDLLDLDDYCTFGGKP